LKNRNAEGINRLLAIDYEPLYVAHKLSENDYELLDRNYVLLKGNYVMAEVADWEVEMGNFTQLGAF